MTFNAQPLRRRDVLAGGLALAGGALLAPAAAALGRTAPTFATQRVVLVIFGGGVRTKETLLSENTPNLRRLAERGVTYPNTVVRNLGHYGAATSILTGRFLEFGIRENARPDVPTLFEIVRKQAGLSAAEVWLSTSGSDQETNHAYSTDADHGARYGANLIGGEGIFNAQFRQLVMGGGGLPRPEPAQEQTLNALRSAIHPDRAPLGDGQLANDGATAARIEQFILEELRGDTSQITGLGAGDAKALHVARNLLAIFRPRLLGVTLRAPDVAHGSYNDHVTVIRRNDAELGKLLDALDGDPELAASTAIFVLPEFGRDRDFNARRGLDHGDSSDELLKVACVAAGPDFRKNRTETREVASIDVAPTIASLFGVRMGPRTGTPLKGLFA